MHLKESEFRALVSAAAHLSKVTGRRDTALRQIVRSAYGNSVRLEYVEVICRMATCASPALQQAARPPVPNWLKDRVIRRSTKCARCRRPFGEGSRRELAHLIPVRLGGVTEQRNLAAFCFDCNRHQGGGLLAVEEYGRIWNK